MPGEQALDAIMAGEDELDLLEVAQQPLAVGGIIARMLEIRDEKKRLSEQESELTEEWSTLEIELIRQMDEQGSKRVSARDGGTAIISETVLPSVDDWDVVYAYIKDNDAFHLLQKRPATAAYRELLESGESVPGISPLTKRSINLRAG